MNKLGRVQVYQKNLKINQIKYKVYSTQNLINIKKP